jgi:hypothetical protein
MTITDALVTHQLAGEPPRQESRKSSQTVRRVIHSIHFTPKHSAQMLWLADAVAFGLRRYYSEQSHGLNFGRAVVGPDLEPINRRSDCACGYMCAERPRPEKSFQ